MVASVESASTIGAMTRMEAEMEALGDQWHRAQELAQRGLLEALASSPSCLWSTSEANDNDGGLQDSHLAKVHASLGGALILFNAWVSWTSGGAAESLACLALWLIVAAFQIVSHAAPHNAELMLARSWLTMSAPLIAMLCFTVAFIHWPAAQRAAWAARRTDGVVFSEVYACA